VLVDVEGLVLVVGGERLEVRLVLGLLPLALLDVVGLLQLLLLAEAREVVVSLGLLTAFVLDLRPQVLQKLHNLATGVDVRLARPYCVGRSEEHSHKHG